VTFITCALAATLHRELCTVRRIEMISGESLEDQYCPSRVLFHESSNTINELGAWNDNQ
jgi:hypothetical protein